MNSRVPHGPAFSIQSRGSISSATLALNRALAGRYRIVKQGQVVLSDVSLYDTFDWRLYNRGLALMTTREAAELILMSDGSLLETGDPLTGRIIKVASIPCVPMRDRLLPKTGPRTLLKVCDATLEKCTFSIIDDIRKTIGTGLWTRAAGLSCHMVTLVPMRGFKAENRLFAEAAAGHCDDTHSRFIKEILSTGYREPGVYSTRVVLNLDPRQAIHTTLSDVIFYFLDTMAENLPGILNDWDNEFLHDYRVAIRRLRTVITEAKKILAPEDYRGLVCTLKDLARGTGDVRDFDVLLSHESVYHSSLPAALQLGLDDFFHWLRLTRQAAFENLVYRINENSSRQSLETLGVLARSLNSACDAVDRSTLTCAAGWIRRRLRRVLKELDAAIGPDNEKLHLLRIDCKKLRYLLEVFTTLFDRKIVRNLTKELKEFQDILGHVNDMTVQQTVLTHLLERRQSEGGNHLRIAASIGGLITEIAHHHPELHIKLVRARNRFRRVATSHKTRRAFSAQLGG